MICAVRVLGKPPLAHRVMRNLHRCCDNYEMTVLFAAQEMAVAMLRHPFRARQMGIVGAARTFRLVFWIDLENDLCDLAPVRALGVCIEQTHIGHQMLLVIVGQHRICRRMIGDCGITPRLAHWGLRLPLPEIASISI